jgi:[acyl-carrier-protein] S-malonyltransferase
MTETLLAMFPGQGSQFVGMGKEVLTEFPKAARTFEEAEDAISVNLRKLCLDGPAEELELTSNQQPSILTLSIAIWRLLQEEAGLESDYFAGHSLGEYSALVASGKLGFAAAVKLVRQRGLAMQKAVAPGIGAMAAVIGYAHEQLIDLCRQESKAQDCCVEVVNFNSPDQQIISGHKKGVDHVVRLLGEKGVKCVLLAVSAPFHSSLMAPAREEMSPLLTAQHFAVNFAKIIPNLTGEITPHYEASLLIEQIDKPVLWSKSLSAAHQVGIKTYLEIGPGRVLFGLARKCLPSGMNLLHSHDLKACIGKISTGLIS